MTIPPDYLVERQYLKHRLRFLYIVIITLILGFLLILNHETGFFSSNKKAKDYIAEISINGVILEDLARDRALKSLENDEKVKAIILQINSPGGSIVGSERLYYTLQDIKKKKPVVAVLGTVAASGGYLISLASDYIVAYRGTITGSIGVILENAEITELAKKLGINFNIFKSGDHKGMLNPMEKLTPSTETIIKETIDEMYSYFVELVAKNRCLPREEVVKIADGRIYTALQAQKLNLIDEVGTTENALEWLRKNKNIDPQLKLIPVTLKVKFRIRDLIKDLSNLADNWKIKTLQYLMR